MDVRADVVVVGAGVIGLSTALRAQRAGARVAVVTAVPPQLTTSAVAAAVWYPTRVEAGGEVADWGAATYAELVRQAADGVPGVALRPTRMMAHQDTPGRPWWAEAVPDLRPLERAELAPGCVSGWAFTAPTVEMPLYLAWMLDRFRRRGGRLVTRRLDSLAQVAGAAPVVVNASGLGARRLCGDGALYPVRGQLVLVRNPGLRTSLRIQDDPAGYTYVHPRSRDVVLGGTFDEGSWDTAADPETARAIIARCTALAPRLRDAEVVGHLVGLRPVRRGGVRLERDEATLPGSALVHNYGHGGAGVTLSWGCADAAVELIG
ncbi:FAD-dependent oxidoreductase [Streptacidiphilus sp. P02-A3a]|uniref:FAD-dependent oxidoreductase n=1 Tax=Streptacidiphilus sp. P02-A3a TaxID=2704468 RepID=UPI0015FCC03D|nr:FAD-dependent oxidoreductase [Streptacidiphilus sp. P02-A3a]QMU69456.1 FAD-binding oxidoreductase [Streptacidiphilus sp. P02-A3a]